MFLSSNSVFIYVIYAAYTFDVQLKTSYLLTYLLKLEHKASRLLTWWVAVTLLLTTTPSIVSLSARSISVHGGTSCLDFRCSYSFLRSDFQICTFGNIEVQLLDLETA